MISGVRCEKKNAEPDVDGKYISLGGLNILIANDANKAEKND